MASKTASVRVVLERIVMWVLCYEKCFVFLGFMFGVILFVTMELYISAAIGLQQQNASIAAKNTTSSQRIYNALFAGIIVSGKAWMAA